MREAYSFFHHTVGCFQHRHGTTFLDIITQSGLGSKFRRCIIATLNNYPNLSQLSAKINGPYDCVGTCIIDGLDYLTGKQFDIDAMMTAVYGPNYHGFTSARAFVPYCEAQGVKLFPIDGDNATLVQAMHQQIQHGFPCLLTEPDPYAPLHPDWSHVLSVYREDPGTLTARDPYSTHDVIHTDAEWTGLLEFREVWVMQRIQQEEELVTIDISNPNVANYFTALSATQWQCKQTGNVVHDGILNFYKGYGNAALCGLTFLGLPKSGELVISQTPYIVLQFFERGVVCWDTEHKFDNPPGSGPAYMAQLYNDGRATDPRLVTARQQIQQLQAQLAQQPPSQAQAILDKIKADLAGV